MYKLSTLRSQTVRATVRATVGVMFGAAVVGAAMLGTVMIGACGDSAPSSPALPPSRDVVVRTDPATPAECPYGGSVVSSGLDDNQNQVLDDSEVQTRTVLCNDAPVQPPPPIVVRLTAEPAGEHCATGGTAVQSGPDRNGNGRLDDDEVTHIDYVCGEPLLTRFAAEPPGPHCVAGGIAFSIGRDRDGDGQLADAEVEQTEYECGDVLSRDVTIESDEDAAVLAKIRVITGALVIDRGSLTDLAFPALDSVGGRLTVTNNSQLVRISLPVLRDVDESVDLSGNAMLATVEAPALQRVGHSFFVNMNPALHDLAGVPQLSRVDGDVQIVGNDALTSVPVILQGVQHVLIKDNPALAALVWSAFTSTLELDIVNNGLETLNLGTAPIDGGPISLGDVFVSNNSKLRTLSVLADQMSSLRVEGNTSLTEVNVFGQEIEHDVMLSGSGQLHSVALASSVDPFVVKGSLFVSGPIDFFSGLTRPIAIDGDCTFEGTHLQTLGPANDLSDVGGTLTVAHNAMLTDISFLTVGGGLSLIDNAVLGSVLLGGPSIDDRQLAFGGDVVITGNPMLRNTQLLEDTTRIHGDLVVTNNALLFLNVGGGITEIDGSLEIENNPALAHLGLSGLQIVGGALNVSTNASLSEVDLPALLGANLGIGIVQNAAVRHLQLPQLRSADMQVQDNVQLPACEVKALFAGIGGSHFQSGNDDMAVCPSP